jgi:hypothetical protein
MEQQQISSVQTSIQRSSSRPSDPQRERLVFAAFVLVTSLALLTAMPTSLRATFADVLGGFLTGPAEGWHGETVAATLSPASRDR